MYAPSSSNIAGSEQFISDLRVNGKEGELFEGD